MTNPLPRTCPADRRTIAQRMPQVPVALTVRIFGQTGEHDINTRVGQGGWLADYANAAARELGIAAIDIIVLSAGPR